MAQEESRRLGHNYVGTEMLLVGVVAANAGIDVNTMEAGNHSASQVDFGLGQ